MIMFLTNVTSLETTGKGCKQASVELGCVNPAVWCRTLRSWEALAPWGTWLRAVTPWLEQRWVIWYKIPSRSNALGSEG